MIQNILQEREKQLQIEILRLREDMKQQNAQLQDNFHVVKTLQASCMNSTLFMSPCTHTHTHPGIWAYNNDADI